MFLTPLWSRRWSGQTSEWGGCRFESSFVAKGTYRKNCSSINCKSVIFFFFLFGLKSSSILLDRERGNKSEQGLWRREACVPVRASPWNSPGLGIFPCWGGRLMYLISPHSGHIQSSSFLSLSRDTHRCQQPESDIISSFEIPYWCFMRHPFRMETDTSRFRPDFSYMNLMSEPSRCLDLLNGDPLF